ncbi:DUF2497 domain-containing protein [Mesorhizobium sp.]|uniref:PopZ family protein n=1 Tax=Mesorhizobium sp. TaxID=1871066 RepID=UPI003BA94941
MATASSAQREPSMEEILASIRRIIEDSDSGRKPAGEADEPRQDLGHDLDLASAPAPVQEVDAFRAELRGGLDVRRPSNFAEVQAQLPAVDPVIARMETPVRSDPAPVKAHPVGLAPVTQAPPTLAEVGARIAAAPVAAASVDVPAAARVSETTDSIVADWRRDIAAVGETIKATTSLSDAAALRRAPPSQPVAVAPDRELAAEPAFDPAPSRDEPASARPAIVSEHTGRQVAAAFGELSDAFASRGKKTFDEMAEEMLRPMLQDWLDNNLPTLVERLVREEIERVARGAQ